MSLTPPRRVLITGATRGIGRSIARRLAEERCRIALTYASDEASAQATLAELQATGAQCAVFRCKLGDAGDVAALPGRAAEWLGGIDCLVNNAGMTYDGSFLTMDTEQCALVLRTNLIGTLRLTAAAVPYLARGVDPAIVILSSLAGVGGKEGQVPYSTSKGGLIGLAGFLGRTLAAQGIRVNAIAPGFIRTDMVRSLEPSSFEFILGGTSLKRMGEPEEVAETVAFLLDRRAGYINATTIKVDGGCMR